MKRTLAIIVLLVSVMVGRAAADAPEGTGEEGAKVRQVVETYLHGLKFNDVPSFEKAFWPGAKLLFVKKNGELGQLTQQDWYKGFASVAGKEEEGTLQVLSLEVTGVAASVKVQEDYPKQRYVNYLSLLKIAGEWKIVNKIFNVEPVAPPKP